MPGWPETDFAILIGQKAGDNEHRCLALFHCGGEDAELELFADRVRCLDDHWHRITPMNTPNLEWQFMKRKSS